MIMVVVIPFRRGTFIFLYLVLVEVLKDGICSLNNQIMFVIKKRVGIDWVTVYA